MYWISAVCYIWKNHYYCWEGKINIFSLRFTYCTLVLLGGQASSLFNKKWDKVVGTFKTIFLNDKRKNEWIQTFFLFMRATTYCKQLFLTEKTLLKLLQTIYFSIGITLPFRETPLKRSKSNPLESNQFLRSEELDFLV